MARLRAFQALDPGSSPGTRSNALVAQSGQSGCLVSSGSAVRIRAGAHGKIK